MKIIFFAQFRVNLRIKFSLIPFKAQNESWILKVINRNYFLNFSISIKEDRSNFYICSDFGSDFSF